jgi:manganese/zinc/iron transport system permease protein
MLNLFARDVHIDVHTVLLGEIGFVWLDTVTVAGVDLPNAVIWMSAMALVNALFVGLFWKELKLSTFDPILAAAFGFRPRLLFYALLFLVSSTAVASFDAVGAILFIAFIIVPPAAAYLLTDRLAAMVGLGVAISLLSVSVGYWLAVAWDVSISGMMALMTGVCLVFALVAGPRAGLIARLVRRRGDRTTIDLYALVVHLHSHERTSDWPEENVAEALTTHLNWPPQRAQRVTAHAVADGYLDAGGRRLTLTAKGRELALSLLEPWKR